jgi:hypothetical protein
MKFNITTPSPALSFLQLYKTINKVPIITVERDASYAVSDTK